MITQNHGEMFSKVFDYILTLFHIDSYTLIIMVGYTVIKTDSTHIQWQQTILLGRNRHTSFGMSVDCASDIAPCTVNSTVNNIPGLVYSELAFHYLVTMEIDLY